MNFFAYQSAAERYARYRPYFHPVVIKRIRAQLQMSKRLPYGLDVASGTGSSTVALRELASNVVGMDVSTAMLERAPQEPGISYVAASAEAPPLAAASFNVITTSLAFHWFDQDEFLSQAERMLKPEGWLIIYTNAFAGRMLENDDFGCWHKDVYLARYPSPPRHRQPLTVERAERFDLYFSRAEQYENKVMFTVEELAAYLSTQSNIIAAVEQGDEAIEDVYHWLVREMAPFFSKPTATFLFGGYIWYLQKRT